MMLGIRLVELRRVLKPGPIAGHYIKIILDSLFGRDKMISQFTWVRTSLFEPHPAQGLHLRPEDLTANMFEEEDFEDE